MNKKLRYGLLTLLAFMGLAVNAQTTFDFDNDYATIFPSLGLSSNDSGDGDITEDVTSTAINGFTVTVSAKEEEASNPNRLWNGNNRLRMYSGTLTIAGSGIENIEFTWSKGNISTETGELKGNVWTGSANRVVFNVLGNTQISKIVINGNAEAPEETEEDLNHGTEEDPISVSEAVYAAGVIGSGGSKDYFYVTGTISSIAVDTKNDNTPFTYSYKGNATYFITDATGAEFEIYKGKYFSGVTWAEGDPDIEEGDVVLVCGKIKDYNGQAEFDSGSTLILLNGKGYEEQQEEPTIQNITVEDFLAEPVSTTVWYRLTGTVKNLNDGDQYGNFDLVDKTGSVYVYGVLSEKGGDKKLFQELVEQYGIKNGGTITIIGNRYYYEPKDQIQVANAYFEGYEQGADPETYEVWVDEALDVATDLEADDPTFDYYQVTGYVVSDPAVPEYQRKDDGSLYGNVNLYIAGLPNSTPTLYIYRAKSVDNANFTEDDLDLFEVGDLVTFKGKLQKHVDSETEETILELTQGYLISAEAPSVTAVTIPESGLATFCYKAPIDIEEQSVYIAKEVGDDKVLVEKVPTGTVIAAGVGIIVEGEGTVTFGINNDEQGVNPDGNLLVGVLEDTKVAAGEAYILVGGKFYSCNAGVIPAGKAYLPISDATAGAKTIVFSGNTTGINEVKALDSTNEIYTIGGVRVKNAQQKGVYIINGKKVVR